MKVYYVIIKVRAGGIILQFVKSGQRVKISDSMRMSGVIGCKQDSAGISLISKTSLVGIVARLMGAKEALYDHSLLAGNSLGKANSNKNRIGKILIPQAAFEFDAVDDQKSTVSNIAELAKSVVKSAKIRIITAPYVSTKFMRRPVNDIALATSGKISDWDSTIGTVRFLKEALKKATGLESPGEIHQAFVKSHQKKREMAKKGEERHQIAELSRQIPDTGLGGKLREIKDCFDRGGFSADGEDKPAYKSPSLLLVKLFKAISDQADVDETFAAAMALAKYEGASIGSPSIFASPDNSGAWLEATSKPVVAGAPGYVANVDFDLLCRLSESELALFLNGPQSASWGEGGFAVWNIAEHIDEELYENISPVVADYDTVRKTVVNLLPYRFKKEDDKK